MVCSNCQNSYSIPNISKCIQKSFEDIKKHFQDLTNNLSSKDTELKKLKEENIRLNRQIIDLNEKYNKKQILKKPLLSPFKAINDGLDRNIDDLNNALNSEQIFELSELNNSNCQDEKGKKDDIDSTKSCTSISKNKNISIKQYSKKNNTNIGNSEKFYYSADQDDATCSSTESWMPIILRPHKRRQHIERKNCVKNVDNSAKRLCSNKSNLNKSVDNNEFFSQDMILESPVTCSKSKLKKSLIYSRVNSGGKENYTKNERKRHEITENSITKKKSHNSIEDITFDFSMNGESSSSVLVKDLPTNRSEFIPNNSNLMKCTKSTKESSSSSDLVTDKFAETSASVMILPSQPKEVVFLDDTSISSSSVNENEKTLDINTMSLLKAIRSKCGSRTESKLKKYEEACLRKSPKDYKEITIDNKGKSQYNRENFTKDNKSSINELTAAQPSFINPLFVFDGINDKEIDCSFNDTEEQKVDNEVSEENDDDDDDAMPRPIIIKQEPEEKNSRIRKDIANDREKDLIQRPKTPDGFWNPHILSFASDDVRNEILIDNRFKRL